LGNVIASVLAPLTLVLPAALSRFYDEERLTEVKTILRYSLRYFLMLMIPVAFGISLLSKSLLTVISTSEIASNGYFITPFIALSALLFGVYGIVGQVLFVVKKLSIAGAVWAVAAVLNLGLNLVLVPKFGIVAAAMTTLAAYGFAFAVVTYFSLIYIKVDIDVKSMLKSIAASLVMSVCIVLLMPVGLINILAVVALSAVIYFVALAGMKGVTRQEVELLLNLFRKPS